MDTIMGNSWQANRKRLALRLARGLGLLVAAAKIAGPLNLWAASFTIANNTFPSTVVGQSATQNVLLTTTAAVAIESIAVQSGFKEYTLGTITGCAMDGTTVLPVGAVCVVPVTFAPIAPGSAVTPALARSGPLLVTDVESGGPVTYAFALTGAATGPVSTIEPAANITLYAGQAVTGFPAGDNGLGQTPAGFGGDGGAATSAQFAFSGGSEAQPMAIDSANDLFVIDGFNKVVRRVDGTTQVVTTVAGTPNVGGYTGDGGPATSATLARPAAIALDSAGDIFLLDEGSFAVIAADYRIRRVDAGSGVITSIAGQNFTGRYSGTGACAGFSTSDLNCGDGGLASDAFINASSGLAIDAAGNLYILQSGGTIRKIDATTKIITTLVTLGPVWGAGPTGLGMTFGADGSLYVAVFRTDLGPSPGTSAIAVIEKVDPITGTATIVAGGGPGEIPQQGGSIATDGDLSFGQATSLAADAAGNIYFPVLTPGYVLRLNPAANMIYPVARGDGGGSPQDGIYNSLFGTYAIAPQAVVVDARGNEYFMTFNQIAEMSGTQATLDSFFNQDDFTTSSVSFPVTVANVGNAPLTQTLAVPAQFVDTTSSDTNPCLAALAPGGACNFDIAFAPTTVGPVTGIATIANNSQTEAGQQQQIFLNGTGVAEAQAVFAPASVNFGNQATQTTSAVRQIAFSNPGTAALGISDIGFDSTPGAADFRQTNTCGASLAPGASCMINVTFTPAAAGGYSATIFVNDNFGTGEQTVALTGTGVTSTPTPQAVLSPTSVAFGSVAVGVTSSAQNITLSNPGTAALTIGSIRFTGTGAAAFSEKDTCAGSVAAAGSCVISVSFKPGSATSFASTLSVADNATGSPQTATLSGTGTTAPAPQAVLTPATLAFPSTAVGTTSAALTTKLSNPGTATLNISGISVTGLNPTDFTATTSCGSTLAAAASCVVSVTFTPASAASFSAAVSVADDATGSPQTAALTGTGAAAPQAVLTPATLTFPGTTVGTTSASLTTTLSNPGNAALTINSVSVTGTNASSFGQVNNCGTSLGAGLSCTITVTFTPGSVASLTAAISVADNATGSPQSAALTGRGTAVPVPQAVLSPNPLAFPSTTVGTAATALPMTLSNTGNAALTINSISVTGTNASSFGQVNNCGTSLGAGLSCTITVTFTPGSVASLTAAISVADNATGSPQSAMLNGTGITASIPGAVLTPATLTFASQISGTTSASQSVMLSNPGTASLSIGSITITGANSTDFALTNGCGSSLAAGANCQLSVTFTPGTMGTFAASIAVADNATGSPQSVALNGTDTAPPDFTTSSPTAPQTVQAGAAATYQIDVASTSGSFNLPVALSATGLPLGATALFTPQMVTPGSTGATSSLVIETSATMAQLNRGGDKGPLSPDPSNSGGPLGLASATAALAGLFLLRRLPRLGNGGRLLIVLFGVLAMSLGMTACGGGFPGSARSTTYVITVTGVNGTDLHTTSVTLTVK